MSLTKKEPFTYVGIIDDDDELELLNCLICKKVGLTITLGKKILLPNEVKAPDYDEFLQCHRCGYVYALHEVPKEDTIKDTIETVDNPFENIGNVESIPKRNSPASKKKRKKPQHEDKDIDLAIKQHGEENVRIIQG